MVDLSKVLGIIESKAAERKEFAYRLLCQFKAVNCPGANVAAAEAAILLEIAEDIRRAFGSEGSK